VMLVLIWRGCRAGRLWPFLAVAAAIGYAGATRWVTWPFIPARLLWLLPFLSLALAIGIWRCRSLLRPFITAAILLSFASSTLLYFRRENFVNLGYNSPVREIAQRIQREASPRDAILVDGFNADMDALRFYDRADHRIEPILPETAAQTRAAVAGAAAVWVIRNTRDVSPGHLVSSVETEVCRGRARTGSFYEPYPLLEHTAVQMIAGAGAPEYFYQVTVCR